MAAPCSARSSASSSARRRSLAATPKDGWDWRFGWGLVGAAAVAALVCVGCWSGWWWRIRQRWVIAVAAIGSSAFATLLALTDGLDGLRYGAKSQDRVPRHTGVTSRRQASSCAPFWIGSTAIRCTCVAIPLASSWCSSFSTRSDSAVLRRWCCCRSSRSAIVHRRGAGDRPGGRRRRVDASLRAFVDASRPTRSGW